MNAMEWGKGWAARAIISCSDCIPQQPLCIICKANAANRFELWVDEFELSMGSNNVKCTNQSYSKAYISPSILIPI